MTVKTVGQPLQGEGSSLGESSASEVYVVSSDNQAPFCIQKRVFCELRSFMLLEVEIGLISMVLVISPISRSFRPHSKSSNFWWLSIGLG